MEKKNALAAAQEVLVALDAESKQHETDVSELRGAHDWAQSALLERAFAGCAPPKAPAPAAWLGMRLEGARVMWQEDQEANEMSAPRASTRVDRGGCRCLCVEVPGSHGAGRLPRDEARGSDRVS